MKKICCLAFAMLLGGCLRSVDEGVGDDLSLPSANPDLVWVFNTPDLGSTPTPAPDLAVSPDLSLAPDLNGPPPCANELKQCGDICVDIMSDGSNCGGCNNFCPFGFICFGGLCRSPCSGANEKICDGSCVDIMSNGFNCGGCDNVCPQGFLCVAGKCTQPEQPDLGLSPDLAPAPDLKMAPDLAMPSPDLTMMKDMTVPPDLTRPADLALLPDLICPKADLAQPPQCKVDGDCPHGQFCNGMYCYEADDLHGRTGKGQSGANGGPFPDGSPDSRDDDGDCYCEVLPCQGSVNPDCKQLFGGDCDDTLTGKENHPGAVDWVGDNFDNNCDGIVQ